MEMVASASGGDDDDDGLSSVVVAGEMEAEIMVVARWRGAVDLAEAHRKNPPEKFSGDGYCRRRRHNGERGEGKNFRV
ncbi:hypothetical protein Tco_0740719 [Tanacetum coccineum]